MIKITVYQDHKGRYNRIHCIGHAEYAQPGEDIVCAGVSVLVINTLNAMEAYTDETPVVSSDSDSGLIDVRFQHPPGHDAQLLIRTMIMGLQDIQNKYGTDYSILKIKEV